MKKLFLIILLTGLFLRFYDFPAWFGFDYDQEINAWIAKTILVDHKPVLIGPETSVGGMYVGPYFNYIISLFFLLGRMNPMATISLNILISAATLVAFYLVGSRLFNRTTGLIAGLLYGFSSFIINYDRVLWNPTPVPLVSLLTVYFLYRFLENSQNKYLALTMTGIGFLLHLHFQAVFLGVFIFLSLLLARPKTFLKPRSYLYILVPLIIFLAPLVLFDLRHDFLNSRHFLQFFLGSSHTTSVNPIAPIARMLQVLLSFLQNISAISNPLPALTVGILLFGISAVRAWRRSSYRLGIALLIFSLILFSFYQGPLPIQYFLFLIPVFVLFPADILATLWQSKKLWRWLSPILIILFLILNIPAVARSKNEINLWSKQQVVKYIAAHSDSNPQIDIVTQPGLNTGFKYLFWQAGLNPHYGSDKKDVQTFKIVVPTVMARPGELTVSFGPIGVQSF